MRCLSLSLGVPLNNQFSLLAVYDCNNSYGESTYRLFTRNGKIIYLQSKGFLEIDKETNKVHSFVCVNTLLDDEEGKRRVQDMKKKFSVIINTRIPQSTVDVPASEHPAQLEKAVLCLIQNLQHGNDHEFDQLEDDEDEDEDGIASMASFSQNAYHQLHDQQHHDEHQHHHQQHHQHTHSHSHSQNTYQESSMAQARLSAGHGISSAKTPPLALVPPETSSVKSSISKSVSVVNVTAAKHLRGLHTAPAQVKSPSSSTTTTLLDSCNCLDAGDMDCDFCQGPLTPETVVSDTGNLKRSATGVNGQGAQDDGLRQAKRRFMPSTGEQRVEVYIFYSRYRKGFSEVIKKVL